MRWPDFRRWRFLGWNCQVHIMHSSWALLRWSYSSADQRSICVWRGILSSNESQRRYRRPPWAVLGRCPWSLEAEISYSHRFPLIASESNSTIYSLSASPACFSQGMLELSFWPACIWRADCRRSRTRLQYTCLCWGRRESFAQKACFHCSVKPCRYLRISLCRYQVLRGLHWCDGACWCSSAPMRPPTDQSVSFVGVSSWKCLWWVHNRVLPCTGRWAPWCIGSSTESDQAAHDDSLMWWCSFCLDHRMSSRSRCLHTSSLFDWSASACLLAASPFLEKSWASSEPNCSKNQPSLANEVQREDSVRKWANTLL